jgi:hypothetical protein
VRADRPADQCGPRLRLPIAVLHSECDRLGRAVAGPVWRRSSAALRRTLGASPAWPECA